MKTKYAAVRHVNFDNYKRVIVMSDIHGDSTGLAGVLEHVHFSDTDALVLVGDLIEKGRYSLEVLRRVMQMSLNGNVYVVLGNNEAIILDWLLDEVSNEAVFGYVASRDQSIIFEMAQELRIGCGTVGELSLLKERIKQNYTEEICFLRELPQIIDSEIAVFVHAGIEPGDLMRQDYDYCLSATAFAEQKYSFEKTVIVGHWPVSNYCDRRIDVNVYFNKEMNVISIDGGNSMKCWEQINYLILTRESMEEAESGQQRNEVCRKNGRVITGGYYDSLPKICALDDQPETAESFTLVFPNTHIEIRKEGAEESICFVPYLNKEITVSNDHIYTYKNKKYCYDFTTYDLCVDAGEVLTFCMETEDGILVKRDGIVGNYHGRYR